MERLLTVCEQNGQGQDRRLAKAMTEGADWVWTQTQFGWIVTTPGGTYQVTERSCSCKDHELRCAGTQTLCKHRCGLAHKLLVEGTPAPPPATTRKGLPLMSDAEVVRMDRLYA